MAKNREFSGLIDEKHVAGIYAALSAAGLGDYRIASLHLTSEPAQSDGRNCHAEKLPNGSWIIVCD